MKKGYKKEAEMIGSRALRIAPPPSTTYVEM